MATLKTIAKACGVSTATVSMVLNNKPGRISKKTRALVLKAAREQNYTKNHLASALALGISNNFGLIIPTLENDYFSELASHLNKAFIRHNKNLLICCSSDNTETEFTLAEMLIGSNIDGLIIVNCSSHDNCTFNRLEHLLSSMKTPVLFLDRKPLESICTSFVSDNEQGGYLATKHLLSLGHKRIGHLSGPLSVECSRARLSGFKRALSEFSISYDQDLCFEGDFDLQSGLVSLPYFIKHDTTAIFASNDVMAYGLCNSALNCGLNIPTDLSIIGFDNNKINMISAPPLTTVSQDLVNMCLDAASYLLSSHKLNIQESNVKLYQPKLVIRNSTAPPIPK